MYRLQPNDFHGNPSQAIIRLSDNAFIPMDKSNTDYQTYLKWVSEGNTPLPADE